MQVKWIHTADVHLGYQQYGLPERAADFARAFRYVCEYAISVSADFMLIAGDLFHKRAVDARTISQAYELLLRLRDANIPVYCVEGNHERAFYNSAWSYLDFLSSSAKLLHLLSPDYTDGRPKLLPWDEEERVGGYVDLGPVRILGIKYHGASAAAVLEQLAGGLSEQTERPFSVMMLHEGLEGQLPRPTGGLSSTQIGVLRPHAEYLALGHVHKQYDFGSWAYNPGSLETVSAEEADWPRGFYEVTADVESRTLTEVALRTVPRRPFHRVSVDVTSSAIPESLHEHVLRQLSRAVPPGGQLPPVVDVSLSGTLQFSDGALQLRELEARVQRELEPLVVRIRNHTIPAGYVPEGVSSSDHGIDRKALELQVLRDLIAQDSRFASRAEEWSVSFQRVKDRALEGTASEEITRILEQGLRAAEDTELVVGEAFPARRARRSTMRRGSADLTDQESMTA